MTNKYMLDKYKHNRIEDNYEKKVACRRIGVTRSAHLCYECGVFLRYRRGKFEKCIGFNLFHPSGGTVYFCDPCGLNLLAKWDKENASIINRFSNLCGRITVKLLRKFGNRGIRARMVRRFIDRFGSQSLQARFYSQATAIEYGY